MDHEVQHHIDVQRAQGKDAETMHLEEHGPVEQAAHRAYSRIEALQVADLHRATVLAGQADDLVSLVETYRQRLFDQQIDSRR